MCSLTIYGAAYGRSDVTEAVKKDVEEGKLTIEASNLKFGDTWIFHRKTMVVVYKYENGLSSKIKTAIVKEGHVLRLSPPLAVEMEGVNVPEQGVNVPEQEKTKREGVLQLEILGAAYGLNDVTREAKDNKRLKETSNKEFDEMATDGSWECEKWKWYSRKKTLVVVYKYNNRDEYMIDIVVEGKRMHFIASPTLRILGAAYGLKCVKKKVEDLVKNSATFSTIVKNKTFKDGYRGHKKTLVIVYQYGDNDESDPKIAIAKEGELLEIMYEKREKHGRPKDPYHLTILGAAYGPKDVTKEVQRMTTPEGGLTIESLDTTFGGNPWRMRKKTLVIVYRYVNEEPETQIIRGKRGLQIEH